MASKRISIGGIGDVFELYYFMQCVGTSLSVTDALSSTIAIPSGSSVLRRSEGMWEDERHLAHTTKTLSVLLCIREREFTQSRYHLRWVTERFSQGVPHINVMVGHASIRGFCSS
jgi:hypothetical protein